MKKLLIFLILLSLSFGSIDYGTATGVGDATTLNGDTASSLKNRTNHIGTQSTNTLNDIPANVSQSQAELGTNPFVFFWSPERVAQAIRDHAISNISSSVDNSILRFDGITGKVVDDSSVTIDDADQLGGITRLTVDNLRLNGNTLSVTNVGGLIILGDSLDFGGFNGTNLAEPTASNHPATKNYHDTTPSPITTIETNVTNDTSTTSTSYVTINGMTNLPASGTYIINLSTSGTGDDVNGFADYAIFKAGSIIQHTERTIKGDREGLVHSQAIVSLNGSEAIEIKFKTDTGAVTVHERNLIFIRVSD